MNTFHPAAAYAPCDDLWVVTTYYNPARYQTKRANYEYFAAPIRAAGIPFITIECAFGDEAFELTAGPAVIQVRGRDVMWVKERLINLAISQLPSHVTKVAWLDADILFTNPEWAQQTSALLDRWPLVQPQDRVGRMARGQMVFRGRTRRSFACQLQRRPESARLGGAAHGQPGIAWAARRDLIAAHGLYDAAILDGGDELFAHAAGDSLSSRCVRGIACAYLRRRPYVVEKALNRLLRIPWPRWLAHWYLAHTNASPVAAPDEAFFAHYLHWAQPFADEVRGAIGCTPGMALHLWHGDPVNRQYGHRNAILKRHHFDPATDLRLNEDGLWEWASDKFQLHQEVKHYFYARREDE
ncbi:hypothetical protein [Candidatus Chloroploca sp. Khr17]|uniref:hypothetical protein n=1 Tax=Candidatus Chloroploca sp. Khr17 TaxID=2496869 RepID=UPI00101D66F4|nr:hypothetical protein [Candidatus Chloroploca sp. Khr17]